MRAIGASGKAIGGMFVGEGVLIGLISWLISIPLSIPLSWVFNDAIGSTIQVQLLFRYSIGGLVMWLALIVVLAAFASGLPAWRAAHTTVREALAYE
jgi:putative ABC transport system permease protein